ncbi:Sensor histidine kinase [hydrothermal vent metagenome]|uniref:histidine kinase n=1 Tax=hydrothermal vent metagenome TaxID=652676 RepID=A0A3B0RSA9_9ZZZZ
MKMKWLNPYLPRSLFGRATLILLLPVMTVLLVVSIVFVQRHFEGVSRQMTRSVSREIQLMLDQTDMSVPELDRSSLARTLGIRARKIPADQAKSGFNRLWYDFTGYVVIREIKLLFPEVTAMELRDNRFVRLYFARGSAQLELTVERRRVSAAKPHQLLVNMVGFGALMTVIAFFYMRKQLRPITRLAAAAEAFGRGRHVEYRPTGAIEVRAAGAAFVDMRARIERQIEQRTLMLSGVSHDLRTPLTRLKLGLSMLEDAEAGRLYRDVEDMERLLDEFLDFARGAQEDEPEAVAPVDLVQQVVKDCQRAKINAVLIETSGEGEVMLREGGIRRAVENLINNAVRYGTVAEVSVNLTDKSLRIRVEDNGPGIPADQHDEALKPFARLEPARNQNKGSGVGLGLSIVNDVARAHGGVLRLGESERLGGLCADIVIAR